jgi:ribosomal protein S18 acetylase RimI-like enzyme
MATITYCKRLRMEVDLRWIDPVPDLPPGFVWVPWADSVLEAHADVKWRSFRNETDSRVFPNLANLDGCVELMRVIRGREGFTPEATWLISAPGECCGTVQGVRDTSGFGMIQNLGVVPEYRGLGLGRALLLSALHGFRHKGFKRGSLEVTARNKRAVRLYHQAGFVIQKTMYRELAEVEKDLYFI